MKTLETQKIPKINHSLNSSSEMILIADSGGSKTDWLLVHNDGTIAQASAPGFNPYYQPIDDLKKNVQEILLPKIKDHVGKIFFYGAGVSSLKNQLTIKSAFME